MNTKRTEILEDSESIAILVGFITGIGVLSLPYSIVKDGKQDSWIAAFVGGIYPLFLSLVSIYFVRKHPNEDILVLSKRYLGSVFGTICNFLFMAQFAIFFISIATGFNFVFIVHATEFLTPLKIYIPSILLAIYMSHKGIKLLGRINMIALIIIFIMTLLSIATLRGGNILNLLPVFGTGYKNIIKSSLDSVYAYGGIEGLFLIYPYFKNKNNIKAIALKATFIPIVVYTWVTFICIYYLGYNVTSKNLWPVLLTTESINLPILNSSRIPFLFLWSIMVFRGLGVKHYSIMYILKSRFKNKNPIKFYWITFPLLLSLCLMVKNEVHRRNLLDIVSPMATLFNIIYISVIGICIFINDKTGKTK